MARRANGLPLSKDVKTFSDGVWVTERTGVSRSRSARTGRSVGGLFGRKYDKRQPNATVRETKKK